MGLVPACLLHAITRFRAEHRPDAAFASCLDRLQEKGFALLRDPDAELPDIRRDAAAFVIHYVALTLCDHRISPDEMDNILVLKRIYGLDEGDLLALQRPALAHLLGREMAQILIDEQVDRSEDIHQSDLQRALGLGYDEYLQLTRQMIRPIVERQLERARSEPSERGEILRKLQGLRRVLQVDTETMTAIWPEPSPDDVLSGR